MHINGRGHRPLTSPFSRGRGGCLCETGFNDPIVDLCHAPPYSTYSLSCIFCHLVRTTPEGVCVSLNRPAARANDLDFLLLKKCCPLYHSLPTFSCLVSLFNTPHICFYLLSHHVLSSTSPAALRALSPLPPSFQAALFEEGFDHSEGLRREKMTPSPPQSLNGFCTVEINPNLSNIQILT